jgi:hypothetical protein
VLNSSSGKLDGVAGNLKSPLTAKVGERVEPCVTACVCLEFYGVAEYWMSARVTEF